MRPNERDRYQVVFSLGEGAVGKKRRRAVEAAATRDGTTLSAWCRRVVLEAAGEKERAPTREEFQALTARVDRLER